MKFISTLLALFVFVHAYGRNDVYDHLVTVNKCWAEQKDRPSLPRYYSADDSGWIRLHLSLVEQTLRSRATAHLNASQKSKRLQALAYLHAYWQQGNFPINDQYKERTPIFIDAHDNFCAVGYLVKATGHEAVSRMIASKTNLAYVREMHYPELGAWANEYGFTIDELAWIQPSYGPIAHSGTAAIGKGTNGEVTALFVEQSGNNLYVGGTFTKVDSIIDAPHIAYVTESNGNYQWHALGSGINGTVHAICEYQGKIFAGGAFTEAGGVPVNNVAYWDGAAWHDAGCTYGTIKELLVHNNELYAVGDFDVCAAMSEVNVAKWNGSNMWLQMPLLEGHVNTITSYKGDLVLGGKFAWMGDTTHVIRWKDNTGYEPFGNAINNEVMDLGLFKDTLYAVCKRTSATDSMLVQQLVSDNWTGYPVVTPTATKLVATETYNTLCVYGDTMMIGGYFNYWGMYDPYFRHCLDLQWNRPGHSSNWFMVDSTINKMVVYKNELVFGGAFKKGENYPIGMPDQLLNGIGKKYGSVPTGIQSPADRNATFKIYPNPAQPGSVLKIANDMNGGSLQLMSIDGRSITSFRLAAKASEIKLPQLAPGTYLLSLTDGKGLKAVQKLIISK